MAAPVVINVPGVPRGKARPRLGGRGVYSDKKSAAFEAGPGWAAKTAMAGREMLEGPLHVDIAAFMPVPTSWSKTKQADALAWKVFPTGNPRGSGGKANPKWEAENLVLIKCPWTLRFEGKFVSGIRIHKKCADSLKRVLAAIWEACGRSQAEIDRIGMSKYGGSYNYREKRSGSSLSMHAYGIAVDFDPVRNGYKNKNPAMDHRVVRAFEAEGWEWGGHWTDPTDGMHFQAARTRAQPKRLPVKPGLTRDEIRPLQKRLRDLGYFEVGLVDGIVGKNTRSGVRNFQEEHGLQVTEAFDDATIKRLATAGHRQATTDSDRSTLTAKDLSKAGDKVVSGAEAVKTTSVLAGGCAAVIGIAEEVGKAIHEDVARADDDELDRRFNRWVQDNRDGPRG